MRNGNVQRMTRRGFTIIELLVVISIMAVLATLATGAALKAVKQSRNKRVDTTCRALEMALGNYKAAENGWPVTLNPSGNATTVWYHGEDNKEVFKPLYHGAGGSKTVYLDASALMGRAKGRRAQLRVLLSTGVSDVALMYPNPDDPGIINFYCVEFNLLTDSVKVHRQSDHTCPQAVK